MVLLNYVLSFKKPTFLDNSHTIFDFQRDLAPFFLAYSHKHVIFVIGK